MGTELKVLTTDKKSEMTSIRDQRLYRWQTAVIGIITDLLEFRDDVTGGHISRTQKYLSVLLNKMVEKRIYYDEISNWDLDAVVASASLHDIGKIAISDAILNKPNKLTKDEFEIMKTHVIIGVAAIKAIKRETGDGMFLHHAELMAGTHHEKWDGSGYPSRLKKYGIPLEGRLMAIADVYDALISERPYKKALSLEQAACTIRSGRGNHFDPVLVDVFSEVSEDFARIVSEDRCLNDLAAARHSWSGEWDTVYGTLILDQLGDDVVGSYPYNFGKLVGTCRGNVLSGTWMESTGCVLHKNEEDIEATCFETGGTSGDFMFTMSEDGSSFIGKWRPISGGNWFAWRGKKRQILSFE